MMNVVQQHKPAQQACSRLFLVQGYGTYEKLAGEFSKIVIQRRIQVDQRNDNFILRNSRAYCRKSYSRAETPVCIKREYPPRQCSCHNNLHVIVEREISPIKHFTTNTMDISVTPIA